MTHNEQQWIEQYEEKGALWIYSGSPKDYHAELTSGKHSNLFFNSRPLIADRVLMLAAGFDLMRLYFAEVADLGITDIVAGPQTGATLLAEMISRQIGIARNRACLFVSPAKNEVAGKKQMVFNSEELGYMDGKSVLLCEDVMSTGGSVELTSDAVTRAGGIVQPYLLVLVNRSGLTEIGGKKIIALINYHASMWEPAECPLCQKGSKAIRPKDNWAALTTHH